MCGYGDRCDDHINDVDLIAWRAHSMSCSPWLHILVRHHGAWHAFMWGCACRHVIMNVAGMILSVMLRSHIMCTAMSWPYWHYVAWHAFMWLSACSHGICSRSCDDIISDVQRSLTVHSNVDAFWKPQLVSDPVAWHASMWFRACR